ncbi:MAG TPA: hypothetical protein VFG69_12585 [Nannocystaceae bacterium]|nr:hypothetical protein [Nannocystaceae bacterium]
MMRARTRRELERGLLGRLAPAARRRLHDRLRSDADARAVYDRAAAALRAMEGRREPADYEVDLVEQWLREDRVIADAVAPANPRWRGLWILAAVLSAAALVLVLRPRGSITSTADDFGMKGPDRSAPFAIEVLCADPGDVAVRPASDGCALAGTLSFAYRVEADWTGGATLVLFGVDAEGGALYYVPTPDTTAPTVAAGRWYSLDRAVRLAVNHRPGRVRVFGLLTDAAPDLDEIDETAALLHALAPAVVGDPPWHERLGGGAIASACARTQTCASAELDLWIHEDRP